MKKSLFHNALIKVVLPLLAFFATGLSAQELNTHLTITSFVIDQAELADYKLAANVYHLYNWAEETFTGEMAFSLTKMDGTILKVLEEGHLTLAEQESIEPNGFIEGPLKVGPSTIPSDLDDGDYQLRIASRQAGYENWCFVNGYRASSEQEFVIAINLHISGMDAILTDRKETDSIVFDSLGRVVSTSGTKGLSLGLYVVNGEKILIR